HWWFVARRQIICSLIRQLVPPHRNPARQATIIDVGCGTGANLAALASDYHAVGIDTSAEAIRMAAERFLGVDFRAGYAPEDLGDCFGEAQLVMVNDVLEHVPDDFRLLTSLLAAMRRGAYCLITVPADVRLWSVHDETFGHYRRYDLPRLSRLWRDLPVETVVCSHFNARLYPLIRGLRTWHRWRGKSAGRAGTDFQMPSRPVNWLLQQIFAGERQSLGRLLEDPSCRTYPRGVSLLAVLRRGPGPLATLAKPADVAADAYDPQARVC
ncbi:MAG: methyltransferase domain-containing protein, partial [Planctomycetales bacterium]|nr:methyltransferase domain-containing protein [Planctomycetales bacterium]